ncbi:MAG: peptidylprolyl isomerase [Bacteroidales bacterium]|nr:peptidylprolyl isomerase [Bacteroidales bacterium]
MFKRKIILLAALITMFFISSCSIFNNPTSIKSFVKVKTTEGDFVIGLYEGTPKHRDNFINNAQNGTYDSVLIYSVVPHGMIKAGLPLNNEEEDFLTTNFIKTSIESEINSKLIHKTGSFGMYRLDNDKNPDRLSDPQLFYFIDGIPLDEKTLKTLETKRNAPLIADYIRVFLDEPQNKFLEDSLTQYKISGDKENYRRLYLELTDSVKPRIKSDGKELFVLDKFQIDKYLEHGGAPIYDGQYTVFGEIVLGNEIIKTLSDVRIGMYNKPKANIYILSTSVLSKKEYKNYKKSTNN